MADVAHKNLTGTDLHEPKDVASASSGEVYVADGAASGDWTANTPQHALLTHSEADGSGGGNTVATTWTVIPMTEDTDADGIMTVSSGAITLQAGTYVFDGWHAFAPRLNAMRIRIYNTTDGTLVHMGGVGRKESTSNSMLHIPITATAVIAGAKVFELQYFAGSAETDGLGLHDELTAGVEIYGMLNIWKIK